MKTDSDTLDLSPIGLDSRDKRVYEALYTLDKASLRSIAQTTGLNRGTVYEVIKRLTDIGLVSFTQTGERRHYMAADPGAIVTLARERREHLSYLETLAASYAQQLKATNPEARQAHFAAFYEGDEGIATILRDVLATLEAEGLHEYRVFSSQRVSNFLYNNFPTFSRRRVQKNIFVRVIADSPSPEQPVLAERKYLLSDGQHDLSAYTIIYGKRTAFISMSPTNVLSGVVVSDEGITAIQKQTFDLLWSYSEANANQ